MRYKLPFMKEIVILQVKFWQKIFLFQYFELDGINF
jgi:hypothetical protein